MAIDSSHTNQVNSLKTDNLSGVVIKKKLLEELYKAAVQMINCNANLNKNI